MAEHPSFATGGRIAPPGLPVELRGQVLFRAGPFPIPPPDLSKLPKMKITIPEEDRMDSPRQTALNALDSLVEEFLPEADDDAGGQRARQFADAIRAGLKRPEGADYLRELSAAHKEFELVTAERAVLIDLLIEAAPEPVREVFRFGTGSDAREALENLIRVRAHRLLIERDRAHDDGERAMQIDERTARR